MGCEAASTRAEQAEGRVAELTVRRAASRAPARAVLPSGRRPQAAVAALEAKVAACDQESSRRQRQVEAAALEKEGLLDRHSAAVAELRAAGAAAAAEAERREAEAEATARGSQRRIEGLEAKIATLESAESNRAELAERAADAERQLAAVEARMEAAAATAAEGDGAVAAERATVAAQAAAIEALEQELKDERAQALLAEKRQAQVIKELRREVKLSKAAGGGGGGAPAAKGAGVDSDRIAALEAEIKAKAAVIDGMTELGRGGGGNRRKLSKAEVETMREGYARLRVVLEETLMKNVHLEQMVEALARKPSP